jgi:hypothetical protein
VAAVHNQLLDQIERKMPAFLAAGRAPPAPVARKKSSGSFWDFVERG